MFESQYFSTGIIEFYKNYKPGCNGCALILNEDVLSGIKFKVSKEYLIPY